MVDPPVISLSAAGGPSTVASPRTISATDPVLRYLGRPVAVELKDGATIVQNQSVTGTPTRGSVYYVEFTTDAPLLELVIEGTGDTSAHRILIDGQYASLDPLRYSRDGALHRTRIDFRGIRRMRRVRVESNGMLFGGVTVATTDNVDVTQAANAVRALFLGASSIEGTLGGDGYAFNAFAPQTAKLLGWSDLYVSGAAGTGYATPSGTAPSLANRFAADALPLAPEVLVISAGYNDTPANLAAGAPKLFDQIQRGLPDTLVFVMGPIDPKQDQFAKRALLLAALRNRPNFYFIDNLGEHWQTGTGSVANPAGDGNADNYVAADGIHLSIAGNKYIAGKLHDAIQFIINSH